MGTLCCSIALAKPIRGTFSFGQAFFGIDANGNQAAISPDATTRLKLIKFPKSGVIINRGLQKKTVNLSGKRQVFRNTITPIIDPELEESTANATRVRQIYPKGKVRKMNLVTQRILVVFNPKKVPEEN